MKIKSFWQNGREILVRKQSSILSAAFVISLTYGVSMVLGIWREALIVARFYSCCRGNLDAYYAAFRLPDMIFQLIVIGALAAAFIPVFSEELSKSETEAYSLASSLINLLLGIFLFLALLIFLVARPISDLITNFSFSQVDLMAQLTRLMLLAQVFFLISSFSTAIIQSHQRFLLPALAPVFYNVGIIGSVIIFSGTMGIWSAAIGVLFGAFLHLLIQLPLLFKLGFRYSFVFDFKNSGVKKVMKLMLPRTLALAVGQVEATVSLFLATSLSSGSLTLYYLAQKLADLPVRLLGTSIGQAALPVLSSQIARGKIEEFKKTLNQTLSQIFYLSLPTTAIFLVLRLQLVRFAYGLKSFPWEATVVTGRTLAAITISIFSQSASQILIRGFYAVHDTNTPFVISCISVVANIALSLFLIFKLNWGIFGLALAFSLASLLNFVLLLTVINFKKEAFVVRDDWLRWTKMLVASLLAGLFAWVSMRVLDKYVFDTTKVVPLLALTVISIVVSISVYLYLSLLLKFKEFDQLLLLLRRITKLKGVLWGEKKAVEPYSETGTPV